MSVSSTWSLCDFQFFLMENLRLRVAKLFLLKVETPKTVRFCALPGSQAHVKFKKTNYLSWVKTIKVQRFHPDCERMVCFAMLVATSTYKCDSVLFETNFLAVQQFSEPLFRSAYNMQLFVFEVSAYFMTMKLQFPVLSRGSESW